jgi:hypothetical protein
MPQPDPTPSSGGLKDALLQALKDHWLCIVLILLAFILGLFARGLFGR